jgi:3-hydroxyisobutyrate dehydrogenase-like beta-hydroxyacid dehydrogenase
VIGLGTIGGGVAASLARSGSVPAVYDLRPEVVDDLDGVPAVLASPAEVARNADVVMIAVLDADQARTVISGPDGLLAAGHDGLILVLLSTVSLSDVRELADLARGGGARLLDCGVTNPNQRARENGLVGFLGGDDATVAEAMGVLTDWAQHIEHCGPLGAGMAAKIARNIITYGSWRVVAEAALLVEGAGVDMHKVINAIDIADPQGSTLFQMYRLRGGTGPAGPELQDTMRYIEYTTAKDLAAAQDLARDLGVEVPLVDVTREHRRETLGLGD